jgi:hypothetical protein
LGSAYFVGPLPYGGRFEIGEHVEGGCVGKKDFEVLRREKVGRWEEETEKEIQDWKGSVRGE